MLEMRLFDHLPIGVIYLWLVLFILLSYEIGYQVGRLFHSRKKAIDPSSLNHIVSGILGMLAFVLAFSFAMASSQHRARRHLVLEEANTVGTAYLRADLLKEPYRSRIKDLLKEYVDVRIKGANREMFTKAVQRSVEIHEMLWHQVAEAAKKDPSKCAMIVVKSINDVIDMHSKRIAAALRARIPTSIWIALLAISALTMITMGVQAGIAESRKLIAVIPLILAFAVLTALVVDLDRPQRGLIKVSQQEMVDLKKSMEKEDMFNKRFLSTGNSVTQKGSSVSSNK